MKKIALTSLLVLCTVAGANAATNNKCHTYCEKNDTNFFVGSGFSVDTQKTHVNSGWSFAPEFGWKVTPRWDLGMNLSYLHVHNEDALIGDGYENKYSYGTGVFARYKLLQFGDVKLLLKGEVDFSLDRYMNSSIAGNLDLTTPVISGRIAPMITYDLNNCFTLFAELNFLDVSAMYQFKHNDNVTENWTFDVVGNSNTVANTRSFLIGFHYNF